jgi:predicted outer membrane repeat protein
MRWVLRLGAVIVSLVGAPSALAATDTVTNTLDGAGTGPAGSLRYVLANAGAGDTIVFAPGVSGTITLTNGTLGLTKSVTITGPGAGTLAIDGGGSTGILSITAGPVSVSGLTFTHGAAQDGGAIQASAGALLTVSDSVFSGNSATAIGGAIAVQSSLSVSDSTFTGNSAGGAAGEGGAIFAHIPFTVVNSTFSANTAGSSGGAIGDGTGTFAGNGPQITNSTFTGNVAGGPGAHGFGGAMVVSGAILESDSIDGNSAGPTGVGGGIYSDNTAVDGTIAAGNSAGTGANCNARVLSSSFSLEGPAGSSSCGFDLVSADPLLGPLASNGGMTRTQALGAGSPAIDAVPAASCLTITDQRGGPRPDATESSCDVGAYETQAPSASITAPVNGATYTLGQVVDAAFACTPGLGAVLQSCVGTAANGAPIDTSTSGRHTFSVTATDTDGQTATATSGYTVVGPPAVVISSPAVGASYVQGQTVAAAYSCQDTAGGPGIQSCTGPVASGSAIDTSTLGQHSFAVTATSLDGQTATATGSYTITAASVPVQTAPPTISGTPLPGDTISCSTGTWSGSPTGYTYQWDRDGQPIPGATGATYTVQIGDEAQTLSCVVTASNQTGPGAPATSAGVLVAVKGTLGCPKPSGRLDGRQLGPLALGLSRAQEQHKLPRFKVIGYGFDNFCLYAGWGIRVGYPSQKLLHELAPTTRRELRGRIVIALTANPYYTLNGVKPGATLATAAHKLKLGRGFHIGRNDWYIALGARANDVIKVRHGIVQEVGIIDTRLTTNRPAQQRLLTSFGAV